MRQVAFFRWLLPDPKTGQLIPSKQLMDEKTGESIPGAQKLADSLESGDPFLSPFRSRSPTAPGHGRFEFARQANDAGDVETPVA
jgi:hypothetical protein